MDTYTVSFFGHRRIYDQLRLDRELDEIIVRLLRGHSYVEFLVGRDGEFDQLVSSAIRRCQREYGGKTVPIFGLCPISRPSFGITRKTAMRTTTRLKSAKNLLSCILSQPSKLEINAWLTDPILRFFM